MTGIAPGPGSESPGPPAKRTWDGDGEQAAQDGNGTKRICSPGIGYSSTTTAQEWIMPLASQNVEQGLVDGFAQWSDMPTPSLIANGIAVRFDLTTGSFNSSSREFNDMSWPGTDIQGPLAWSPMPVGLFDEHLDASETSPQLAQSGTEANATAFETLGPMIQFDLSSYDEAPAAGANSSSMSYGTGLGAQDGTPFEGMVKYTPVDDEDGRDLNQVLDGIVTEGLPGAGTEDCETVVSATESANGQSGEDSALSVSREDEYEVCFGVLETVDVPLLKFDQKKMESKSVKLSSVGDSIVVLDAESGAYRGLVSSNVSKAISKLQEEFNVTISSSIRNTGTTTLAIIIYGAFGDGPMVGDMLMDCNCFLQRPDFFDASVPYQNPQSYSESGSKANPGPLSIGPDKRGVRKVAAMAVVAESKSAELLDCASGPEVFTERKASEKLSTQLKWFQKKSLAMMTEKESGELRVTEFPSVWTEEVNGIQGKSLFINNVTSRRAVQRPQLCLGGLLADDMGLGKSLTTLALIAGSLTNEPRTARRGKSTIIVAPLSTLSNWEDQIRKHFHEGSLTFSFYHGANRHKILDTIEENDIVLTTYQTLSSECPHLFSTRQGGHTRRTVYDTVWHRIVLDEAHVVKNRTSQQFQAVCSLNGRHRWCLTGTPIHNTIDDLGALVEFLRVHPFNDRTTFRHLFMSGSSAHETQQWNRLKHLFQAISLRRTKENLGEELQLPVKEEVIHYVTLNDEETSQHNHPKSHSAQAVDPGDSPMNCFQFITRLRQICNHGDILLPQLLRDWLRKSAFYSDAPPPASRFCEKCEGEAWPEEGLSLLECCHQICASCLSKHHASSSQSLCPICELSDRGSEIDGVDKTMSNRRGPTARSETHRKDIGVYRPSSKVAALIQNLESDFEAATQAGQVEPKSVVFSAWRGMLDLIEIAFLQRGIGFERLDGSQSLRQRETSIRNFRSKSCCRLLLATLGSGGVGLDFTVASRVHLMEPGWNPMLERQALDRVHRLGQTERVLSRCYVVAGQGSIEQYILDTQRRKLELASSLVEDRGQVSASRSTLKEFREFIRSG